MNAKRLFDLSFTIPGLIVLAPLFCLVAVWIKLDSAGPVFFRQERVGRDGKPFRIYKFRTMHAAAEKSGLQITTVNDSRITESGKFLRACKMDELPQLINVLKGEMSLVGPRPEVPRYVALYPADVRQLILSVLPGITDYASIMFKNENEILGRAGDPEKAYIDEILPIKMEYYKKYVAEHSVRIDFLIILQTLRAILSGRQ